MGGVSKRIAGAAIIVVLATVSAVNCGGDAGFVGVSQTAGQLLIQPDSLTFSALGDTATLAARLIDSDGDTLAVAAEWESLDPGVATIGPGGLVTAIGTGTTSVLASTPDDTVSVEVRVAQVASHLSIEPEVDTLHALGETLQLTPTVLDANGHAVTGRSITWTSDQPNIAEVDSMGRVLAQAAGAAIITASIVCCSDSTSVVVDPTVDSIEVSPATATIDDSGTQQFTATAYDADGGVVQGVSFQWSSSNGSVASVDGNGLATALGPGTTSITAANGSNSGSASLTVNSVVSGETVSLDASQQLQVMSGWEAVAQAGQVMPGFDNWKDDLYDRAVNELGINRLRLAIRAGAENTEDYYTLWRTGQITDDEWRCVRYATVNDNADPSVANASGFQFTELDYTIDTVILPMKQRMEARGEHLYVNLNYTAFTAHICSGYDYDHLDPDEYAEFILQVFNHMQADYGFVPDAVEIILEPDNSGNGWIWGGAEIGAAMVATESRLAAAGYSPEFIAPSTTEMTTSYFDAMVSAVPASADVIDEFSYHRYRGNESTALPAIGSRVQQYGIRSSMLEHIGSGHEDLHNDITIARVSGWQQFGLAWPTSDNGAQYFYIENDVVKIGSRTKFLRQYFQFVRLWAQRIGATSSTGVLEPLGFINTDGTYVVVVKASGSETFSVEGLPAGTYGIKYTTSTQYDVNPADITISAGEPLQTNIPAAGVITIYQK